MQTPRKKHSRARRDSRRAHDFIVPKQSVKCSNCGELTLPHHVCPACGFYRGRQVVRGTEAAQE